MIRSLETLRTSLGERGASKIAVAVAQDAEVLLAVDAAAKLGIATAVLVGDEAEIRAIAEKLNIGVAKVYSVATFYENFSLEAKGKYIIKVCNGTACHVRKSQPIFDALHDYLGLTGEKKTSADGLFTLETVACLGACSLAPAMTVNDEVFAKMSPESAIDLINVLREKEAGANG